MSSDEVSRLIPLLFHESESVREDAAGQLGRMREAVPELLRVLKRGDWAAREAAMDALFELAEPSTARAVAWNLISQNLGERASETLIKIGQPSVPPLINLLKNREPLFRKRAAEVLTKFRHEVPLSCLSDLLVALRRNSMEEGATYVRWALSQIGEPAVPHLILALKENVGETRVLSSEALSNIGDPASIPARLSALVESRGEIFRDSLLEGLRTNHPGSVRDLRLLGEAIRSMEEERKKGRAPKRMVKSLREMYPVWASQVREKLEEGMKGRVRPPPRFRPRPRIPKRQQIKAAKRIICGVR